MEVAVPKHGKLGQGFSAKERLKADEHPGRPNTRLAGGWVSDLAELQKFIQLCPFCVSKFNPRKSGYEVWRTYLNCVGKCDGCNQLSPQCRGFISEQYHTQVGEFTRTKSARWRLK
jgi:hypothetical protein